MLLAHNYLEFTIMRMKMKTLSKLLIVFMILSFVTIHSPQNAFSQESTSKQSAEPEHVPEGTMTSEKKLPGKEGGGWLWAIVAALAIGGVAAAVGGSSDSGSGGGNEGSTTGNYDFSW